MSEKVIFPIFGSQSITAVLAELKGFEMTFDARMKLADALMREFKEVRFKVMFDPKTGNIETIKQLSND